MEFCKGELVVCTAGREKERLMCVVGCDESYVYLCDGGERPMGAPKRKNPKHIIKTGKSLSESAMRTDKALRKALLREV